MRRILFLISMLTLGFSSCTKEDEVSLLDSRLDQEEQLKAAQKDFLDVLSPLRGLSIGELREIVDSEDPLKTLEKYTQIDKKELLRKAALFQKKLEILKLNQTELANILMPDNTENSSSFMVTSCYDEYEKNLGIATAGFLYCLYASGGSVAAGCTVIYGLTVLALDSTFEACLKKDYPLG